MCDRVVRKPFDILEDPTYSGQTSIVFKFVPLLAKDDLHVVDEAVMAEYVNCAIEEEDMKAKKIKSEMAKVDDEISEMDKIMRKIPKQEFRDQNGYRMFDCRPDRV